MEIFIDSDYKIHTKNAEGLRKIETSAFNGKCKQFIEGYRYIPKGDTWIRQDGNEFIGEMSSPWKDYEQLRLAQESYEEAEEITQIITGEVVVNDEK